VKKGKPKWIPKECVDLYAHVQLTLISEILRTPEDIKIKISFNFLSPEIFDVMNSYSLIATLQE
jgi:hypothetical protein